MTYKKNFPILGDNNEELSFIQLTHNWGEVYLLRYKQNDNIILKKNLSNTICDLFNEIKNLKLNQIHYRFIKGKHPESLKEILIENGFKFRATRIEYTKKLSELPNDKGTPLNWKTALDLNFSKEKIAEIILAISIGDPGYDPNENPLDFIEDYLNNDELTHGLECIHFGFYDNEIAAMTVTQIDPKDGWSRIAYMGVIPKFRNIGLGKYVHRYSFMKLKEQGGILYHGGTDATNLPMLKLFKMHNCDLHAEMEEYFYEK